MSREPTIERRRAFLRARGNKHHDCTHIATLWLAFRREQEQLVMDVQKVFEDSPDAEFSAESIAAMTSVPFFDAVWALVQCEEIGVAVREHSHEPSVLWKCANA